MITYHGIIPIPQAIIDLAQPIKLLNYKTTTPAKFKKNELTEVAGDLMSVIADRINIAQSRLDYVYFSASKGAEPHTDLLSPEIFTERTFVIPVILPTGRTVIEAGKGRKVVEIGGIYEFNHEEIHSMAVEDEDSGCVVIMVAIKH